MLVACVSLVQSLLAALDGQVIASMYVLTVTNLRITSGGQLVEWVKTSEGQEKYRPPQTGQTPIQLAVMLDNWIEEALRDARHERSQVS